MNYINRIKWYFPYLPFSRVFLQSRSNSLFAPSLRLSYFSLSPPPNPQFFFAPLSLLSLSIYLRRPTLSLIANYPVAISLSRSSVLPPPHIGTENLLDLAVSAPKKMIQILDGELTTSDPIHFVNQISP